MPRTFKLDDRWSDELLYLTEIVACGLPITPRDIQAASALRELVISSEYDQDDAGVEGIVALAPVVVATHRGPRRLQ